MADVVAAEQVVRGVVRLEVPHRRLFDLFGEQGLVAVQEGRAGLGNGLLHGIDGVWGQHVVVVRQGQILPGGQRRRVVGVVADALVLDHLIADALARLLGRRVYQLFHRRTMGVVRGIRQAQFPTGAGLVQHTVQQLAQEGFRRIVQRHTDGDHRPRRALGALPALGLQHLFFGQIAGLFAKEAPLDEANGPPQHRPDSLLLQHLEGVGHQLFDAFQFQIQWRVLSFDGFQMDCGLPYFRP